MFFCCNNMYQPVPSFPHCIASVSHTLVLFALSVSFLVLSIIIWWTASAHYYYQHKLITAANHTQSQLAFHENPERRKKKLLDYGGCFWGESCFLTRACCFLLLPYLAR
jgi:hypothetical protein